FSRVVPSTLHSPAVTYAAPCAARPHQEPSPDLPRPSPKQADLPLEEQQLRPFLLKAQFLLRHVDRKPHRPIPEHTTPLSGPSTLSGLPLNGLFIPLVDAIRVP